jgi:hypothetical protein
MPPREILNIRPHFLPRRKQGSLALYRTSRFPCKQEAAFVLLLQHLPNW